MINFKKSPLKTDVMAEQYAFKKIVKHQFTVLVYFPRAIAWQVSKLFKQMYQGLLRIFMPQRAILSASRTALMLDYGPSCNVYLQQATKARGLLRFSRLNSDSPLQLGVGIKVASVQLSGHVYFLLTTQKVYFSTGEHHSYVIAEADAEGIAFNLPAYCYQTLVKPIKDISVTNDIGWLIKGGIDEETTEHYRQRILRVKKAFSHIIGWNMNNVYKMIITHFSIPMNNIEIINHGPCGLGAAKAYIYLEVGRISEVLLNVINQYMHNTGHGDNVVVYKIPTRNYTLSVTYQSDVVLTHDITTFIKSAFRQNNVYRPTRVKPYTTLRISQLKIELYKQFDQLKNIRFNCDDINCGLWLPRLIQLQVKKCPY